MNAPRMTSPVHALLVALAAIPASAITIDWVTVGDPGNVADTTGYGAVGYAYRMGTYDVTISQYAAFLNAVDPHGANPYGIYNPSMASNPNVAGIFFDGGQAAGAMYAVMNNGGFSGNRPITYVSWFDAARFTNWVHNGQGSGDTETGAYTLGGATSGNAVARNPGASVWIPTEDEWYKAAYYSPAINSGTGGYYQYATQSNATPGNVIGSGTNQANYRPGGTFSVTQATSYDANQNYLTDVGAFSTSASFYGTFDQSGNVSQWNDLDGTGGSPAGVRGGDWAGAASNLTSSDRSILPGSFGGNGGIGFRLAGPAPIPEIDPAGLGSVLALVTGTLGLLERRRKPAA